MNYFLEIKIGLKDGIIDPEGASTKKALEMLGFKGVSEVHSMKIFSISLDAENEAAAKKTADEMCRKLLANPVINSYDISVKSE